MRDKFGEDTTVFGSVCDKCVGKLYDVGCNRCRDCVHVHTKDPQFKEVCDVLYTTKAIQQ